MLTYTLQADPERPCAIPMGRTVDRRQAWRERYEARDAGSLSAAYAAQSAHTVAGRRAEYQPMRNGIDKGLTTAHNACTHGDNDHA